jgi:uncharacterized protein YqeY
MADTIKSTIQQQMKDALKGGKKERLAVLRMVYNEITSTQVNNPTADEMGCVRVYLKKLTKAKPEYEKIGAADKVAELNREIAIVEEFLPAAMSDQELEQLIEQMIAGRAFTQKDFGTAMKEILAAAAGRTEGGRVSAILKAKLAGHG